MSRRDIIPIRRQVTRIRLDAGAPAQAAGSLTDAGTLQGHPAGDFALAGHDHAGVYAPFSMPIYTTATRPAAGGTWRGVLIIIADNNADDVVQVCRRLDGGTYEWSPIVY